MDILESQASRWQVQPNTVENVHAVHSERYKAVQGDISDDQLWFLMKKRLDVERSKGEEPTKFHKDRK